MGASGIFISILIVLLIFNFVYVSTNNSIVNNMVIGGLTSLVTTAIILSIASGVQVLGSGLNTASIKILFGVSALIQILFSLNFSVGGYNFNIGLGLMNNLFSAFASQDLWGLGLFITTSLAFCGLVSGLMIVIGGND